MPRKPSGAPRSPQKKHSPKRAPSIEVVGSGRRAEKIIDLLLLEMQRGVAQPERLLTPEWEVLFGSKQSMVANVQKLVAALAALPEAGAPGEEERATELPLTEQEMVLLTAWLADRDETT